MSFGRSWNKLGRKGHRHERAQPQARRHLGFLQHKSDYTARAKNYHKKQDELNHLRLLASMKNPDEFHSDMVHTKALDGRLWIDREGKMNKTKMKIFRDNDSKYITMRLQHEQNKLKRELNSFHCIDAANLDFNDNKNDINNDESESAKRKKKNEIEIVESSKFGMNDAFKNKNEIIRYKHEKDRKCDHIIFVDNNEKRSKFNASSYFGTPKELLHQKANRLKTSQLTKKQIQIGPKLASRLKKQTLLKYWQIQGRINKVEAIKKYQHHLNLKRKINSGDKYLCYKKRDPDSGKIVKKRYKWPKERKK